MLNLKGIHCYINTFEYHKKDCATNLTTKLLLNNKQTQLKSKNSSLLNILIRRFCRLNG